jgi:hypothetical protein
MGSDSKSVDHHVFAISGFLMQRLLRTPRKLFLYSLHFQLIYPLKWKKKEQRFILSRLELFDQQFCLDQIRYLYQIYFDQGLKYQIWPVSF